MVHTFRDVYYFFETGLRNYIKLIWGKFIKFLDSFAILCQNCSKSLYEKWDGFKGQD